MKSPRPSLFFLACATFLSLAGCNRAPLKTPPPSGPEALRRAYQEGLDSLSSALVEADSALRHPADSARNRALFREARLRYKYFEFVTEYYSGGIASKMNGPDLPEWDEDEAGGPPEAPEGLQVWEGLLYPAYAPARAEEARAQVRRLQARTAYLKATFGARAFGETDVFDALMLETARIATLGLTGFDSPQAALSLTESATALDGVRTGFAIAFGPEFHRVDPQGARRLDSAFSEAIASLRTAPDFDGFDRHRFLVHRLNPVGARLRAAQEKLGIPLPTDRRALNPGFATVFDAAAFDPWYFAPEKPGDGVRTAREHLGRLLFFDPLLSGNGQRACASCHHPEKAFTDGLARARGFDDRGLPLRNAPTLINAGLQRAYFSDLAVIYLEDQASQVLRSEREMHAAPPAVAGQLLQSPEYAELFKGAFPGSADTTAPVDLRMRQALAAYIRSLVALNSPFDRSMRGDSLAMSEEARRGFNLFAGKAKCATCHFIPLLNGTVPPGFAKSEKEVLGTTGDPDFRRPRLDPDPGRYGIAALEGNRHAFKTPTLRNVALTAPYMHNGAFKTLEQVVAFYNAGGGAGLGLDVPNQTLPADSLRLSAREASDLVAFLNALTDTAGTTGRPDRLPSFPSNPRRNARKIGGEY